MFIRERRSLRKAKIRLAKEQLSESSGIKLKLKAIVNLLKAYGSFFMEALLADLTCEYGTNWKRPIVLWCFVVLIFYPFLYFITQGVLIKQGNTVISFFDYFYFSIVTATTLWYGDLHPIGIGKFLHLLKLYLELSCGQSFLQFSQGNT